PRVWRGEARRRGRTRRTGSGRPPSRPCRPRGASWSPCPGSSGAAWHLGAASVAGVGGGVAGGGGPGDGEPGDLAGPSRVLTPEHRTEGQLPPSSAPPDFPFLVPRAGRPTTAGEARGAWGCGARPCGGQPVAFVGLQRASSAPALLCALDWPRILPAPQPFSLQDFRGAGSLTPSTPSVQRACLLYPPTCNLPRLQTPSKLSLRRCPRRDPSHLPAPGNCRGGGFFPGGRLRPGRTQPPHRACVLSARFCPVPPPCRVPVFGTQKPWQRPHLTPPPASLRLPVCAASAFSSAR
ncbi:hypothetical protein GH733_010457, partial [Mirounga leonina]